MKSITILSLHLGYGGIEKAITTLSNMLIDKYEITVVSTYQLYDKPAFEFDKRVKIIYLMKDKPNKKEFFESLKQLNFIKTIKQSIKSIKVLYLKRKLMIDYIKKYNSDVIISTRPFHNKLLGKYGNKQSLKIAWEHSHHNNNKRYIKKLIKSCEGMDYLVNVSKDLNEFYKNKLIGTNTKSLYIPLALDYYPDIFSKLDTNEITSIGRLSKEKGYLDLIDVFKIVGEEYPNWKLNIVGDGFEKDKLLDKILNTKLEEKVILHGFKEKHEIDKILLKTSLYVMTSFTESFGLVLIEAMSYGIPCIAFDSAKGPLEIINDGINGFIVKSRNKQEMANLIINLIKNDELRKNLGQNALIKSKEFNGEKIKDYWITLLK